MNRLVTPEEICNDIINQIRESDPIEVKRWLKKRNISWDPKKWTTEQKTLFELTWGD